MALLYTWFPATKSAFSLKVRYDNSKQENKRERELLWNGGIQPCYIQSYQDAGFSQIILHTYMKNIIMIN